MCSTGAAASRAAAARRCNIRRVLIVVLAAAAGCGLPGRPIRLSEAPPQSPPTRFEWSDYAAVLRDGVRPDGVDYAAVIAARATLDRALAALARVGPTATPALLSEPGAVTAFWINAYNAAILRANAQLMAPDRADNRATALPLRTLEPAESAFSFEVDGRSLTPAAMRAAALAAAGDDWRVHFALCDGTRGGPALRATPYLSDALDMQLNEALSAAFDQPQLVFIDHAAQRLGLWGGWYDAPPVRTAAARGADRLFACLLDLASPAQRRRLNTAIGYDLYTIAGDPRANHAAQPANM